MTATVEQIIELIDRLPEDDREALELRLAERAEAAWQLEATEARRTATKNGIDQQGIDAAVSRHRQGE